MSRTGVRLEFPHTVKFQTGRCLGCGQWIKSMRWPGAVCNIAPSSNLRTSNKIKKYGGTLSTLHCFQWLGGSMTKQWGTSAKGRRCSTKLWYINIMILLSASEKESSLVNCTFVCHDPRILMKDRGKILISAVSNLY